MRQAPTSDAQGTATGDLEANARLFARHLRAGNRSPATIVSYMAAIRHLDTYLAAQGMPRDVGTMRREHVEAFIEDQLARLKPASAAGVLSTAPPGFAAGRSGGTNAPRRSNSAQGVSLREHRPRPCVA